MKTIYIVGGDGFARECYQALESLMDENKTLKFGGFLGHGGYGNTVDYKSYQHLYIGEVSEHKFSEDEYVLIGSAYPKLRKKIYDELKERNIKFFTLINKGVNIPSSVQIGEACVIGNRCVITADIKIGNGNVFNGEIIVGHDCEIGDFNFFAPRSQVLGNCKIGSFNTIGANAILLPKAKIGNNNKIAPLSAVYRGCKDNCYMMGNPALKEGIVEDD